MGCGPKSGRGCGSIPEPGNRFPDDHELAELRKETDQRVLANLLRLNLQREGAG